MTANTSQLLPSKTVDPPKQSQSVIMQGGKRQQQQYNTMRQPQILAQGVLSASELVIFNQMTAQATLDSSSGGSSSKKKLDSIESVHLDHEASGSTLAMG